MITLTPHLHGQRRAGTWWTAGDALMWGCPNCGQAHRLTTHTLNEDGHVLPSVMCFRGDFHDYIALEECSPETFLALEQWHFQETSRENHFGPGPNKREPGRGD